MWVFACSEEARELLAVGVVRKGYKHKDDLTEMTKVAVAVSLAKTRCCWEVYHNHKS